MEILEKLGLFLGDQSGHVARDLGYQRCRLFILWRGELRLVSLGLGQLTYLPGQLAQLELFRSIAMFVPTCEAPCALVCLVPGTLCPARQHGLGEVAFVCRTVV